MFACSRCGARCGVSAHYCARCSGFNSFVPVVVGPGDGVIADTAVITAATLYKRHASFLKLGEEWREVLGRLPCSPFMLAIHGPPGSRKTTTTVKLASHLCEIGAGPVLVDQLEEGFGPSFVDVLRRLEVAREDLYVCSVNSLGPLVGIVRETGARVVVIDSLSVTGLSAEDLLRFVRETECSLIFVLQETKTGEARGSLSLVHAADVVLRLELAGTFSLTKSRFSERREGRLPWVTAPSV